MSEYKKWLDLSKEEREALRKKKWFDLSEEERETLRKRWTPEKEQEVIKAIKDNPSKPKFPDYVEKLSPSKEDLNELTKTA